MPKGGRSVKRSFLVKTLLVAVLAMILMLPVAMIRDLVAERQARRNEAVSGIAEGWGKRQTVAGPYLAIPYERHWTVVKRETVDGKLREIRTERSESQVVRRPARRPADRARAEARILAVPRARRIGSLRHRPPRRRYGRRDARRLAAPLVPGALSACKARYWPERLHRELENLALRCSGRRPGGELRLPVQPDGGTNLRVPDRTGRPLPATRARLEVWLPLHRPHLRRLSSVRAPPAQGVRRLAARRLAAPLRPSRRADDRHAPRRLVRPRLSTSSRKRVDPQSRCAASHSFAAFTSASKALPLSSSARLSAGSSGCSMPVSSSGILSSRTAFISLPISPEACAGVCMITSRRIGRGLLGMWQFLHCASSIRSAMVQWVESNCVDYMLLCTTWHATT